DAAVGFTVGAASAGTSTITAAPSAIAADGASTSTVTVQLKDAGGNDLTVGGDAVTLATDLGTLGAVTDNGDGSYTATLTSSTTAGAATVTGTVNTVAITSDVTVSFLFLAQPRPLLTIIGSGDGDGMVRSEPSGIDCLIAGGSADGGDCDENYDDGMWVTLSARPDTGSAFAAWDSTCEGTRPCAASMDQDRTIMATFQQVAEPDADAAAEHLLGRPRLTLIERLFLDQWGNDNYTYDLGDFLALLNRTGQSVSAAIMKQILELPRDWRNRGRPDPER
ncbi:MAG: Ig-like domain-containing protein, partial [Gemmatimonadota bacterium]